jgi:prepilin-type N-terminal cleavage/methylation domain-containing protein
VRRTHAPRLGLRTGATVRGFTLVELMVALSGGLFLSAIVFALSRDSTRFYQQETRIASATLAGLVGFERLKSDIQRAGYLSTPNIQRDPRVLERPTSASPLAIQQLASLRITPNTPNLASNASYAANISAGQTITPDQLLLSGSYIVADEFPIAHTDGTSITLQVNTPPMARLGYIGASTASQDALIANVFAVGKVVRVVDRGGRMQFSSISAVTGSPRPVITLATAIQGLGGYGTGGSINIVNIVRYQIRDLQADGDARWTPLFAASAAAPGEASRTELVREELNAAGQVIAGSSDIVAEYAVDLDLSISGQLAAGTPGLVRSVPGDTNFATFFQAAAVGDRPQGVRSVRVRLGVRSREADRPANITGGTGVYRFKVGTNDGWARVRNFQAEVSLPNQMGVQW